MLRFHSYLNVSSLIHLAWLSTLVSKDLSYAILSHPSYQLPGSLNRICILRFIARIFNLMKLAMICVAVAKKRFYFMYIAEGICLVSLVKIWADGIVRIDYNTEGKQSE